MTLAASKPQGVACVKLHVGAVLWGDRSKVSKREEWGHLLTTRLRRHWVGLGLTAATITRVAAIITPRYWHHWMWVDDLADDWLSVLFLMLTTSLLWLTFKGSVRKAEEAWSDRHAALEEEWGRRHASLLARERELLSQMTEARVALGIGGDDVHLGLSKTQVQEILSNSNECTLTHPPLYIVPDAS